MKILFFACTLLIFCSCGSNKKTGNDTADNELRQRLEEFMRVNDDMNLEKVMDYTYPKLFTIAPRTEMIKILQSTFDNEDVKVNLDSLRIDTIYPVFQSGKGNYAKVKYSMLMLMEAKSTSDSVSTAEKKELMMEGFSAQYGGENVRIDDKGIFRLKVNSLMIAAKDENSPQWTFLNFKEEDEMTKRLFPKDIMDKMKTYK